MTERTAERVAAAMFKHKITTTKLSINNVQSSWRRVITNKAIHALPEDNLLEKWYTLLVVSGHIGRVDCWLTRDGRVPKGLQRK